MERIGIVFSGGGGKGAYEVGVWKALKFLELDKFITGVSGTSIGGLNGVLFALNDFDTCLKTWMFAQVEKKENTFLQDKLLPSIKGKIKQPTIIDDVYIAIDNWVNQNFLSSKKLDELIENKVNVDELKNSEIDTYVTCHDYIQNKATYFYLNEVNDKKKIKKILRATASIPVIFKPVMIEKHVYGDGGISDNTPIKPLYDNGFDKIIVVSLKYKNSIDLSCFPNSQLYVITPSSELGNFINGSLNFYSDVIENRIEQGFKDAVKFFMSHPEIFLVNA